MPKHTSATRLMRSLSPAEGLHFVGKKRFMAVAQTSQVRVEGGVRAGCALEV